MTSRIPENPSAWLVDWSPVTIMVNTMPPRDPNDDDEEDDDENQPDEPAVVREPDDEY
jgi:hypothetical protein